MKNVNLLKITIIHCIICTAFFSKFAAANLRFALPNESKPYTFKMVYNYDSFNRIQQMTYPDGEVVDYHYNLGGMLESIRGQMNTLSYNYISHISYNEFEMKDTVVYGNGSKTTYQYDTLQRLQRLISLTGLRDTMQNIIYQYDSVGNILDITNSAPALTNGLGGTYSSHYDYDSLYRLIGANGNWYGNPNTSYNVEMDYYSNGRVKTKTISNTQTVKNHNFDKLINYVRNYEYSSGSNKLYRITHQNRVTQRFIWDGNGNMIQNTNIPNYSNGASLHLDTARTSNNRQYCWDEDNRLQGVVDNNYASYYQYDASGERTYKCTGKSTLQVLNGRYSYSAQLDNPTLYASPYVVCTPKGYTKHYYAESERVASKIGDRLINSICSSINTQADFNKHDEEGNPYLLSCSELGNDWASKIKKNNTQFSSVMGCLEAKSNVKKDMLSILYGMNFVVPPIAECYWYHPDHLGSSSWITFSNGEAVQHLHYLPWGEDFVDQRTTNWAARYSFSAKERDTETGLSYFGARYYSGDLSIWLSVDPMSDKYPSLSPYVYCADNPVRCVDPNGEEIVVIIEGKRYKYNGFGLVGKDGIEYPFDKKSFGGRVLQDLNSLRNSKSEIIRGKMKDLINSKHIHTIRLSTSENSDGEFNHTISPDQALNVNEGSSTDTYYNPFNKVSNCADGDRLSCATLAHELLGHGWNKDRGLYNPENRTPNGIRFEEINAVNIQNIVLSEHGLNTRKSIGKAGAPGKLIPEEYLNKYFTGQQ